MSAPEPETTEDAKWSETPALMLKKVAGDAARLLEQKRPAILQFFKYAHLPQHLQDISAPYSEQAFRLFTTLPDNEERAFALRKLLESKDAAVRAMVGQ